MVEVEFGKAWGPVTPEHLQTLAARKAAQLPWGSCNSQFCFVLGYACILHPLWPASNRKISRLSMKRSFVLYHGAYAQRCGCSGGRSGSRRQRGAVSIRQAGGARHRHRSLQSAARSGLVARRYSHHPRGHRRGPRVRAPGAALQPDLGGTRGRDRPQPAHPQRRTGPRLTRHARQSSRLDFVHPGHYRRSHGVRHRA